METFVASAVQARRRIGMLAVLGALSSFGPLSMDMYLPSTPTIAANLHASQSLVQLTLSGCLAGLAVGQLVAGPVSDGLGRKKPLLAGLVAFTVLSVACAAAPDIGALIAFRFLQGMAGAGGVVLSLAIVRDLYTGTELARVLGSLMLVFGLAPVLAPVIGGQILRFTSWRGVFGVLAVIGLVLFLLSLFLPETLPPDRRTPSRLHQLIVDSRTLVGDRQYVGYALAITCGNAALITYISALPFIIEDAYHESPQLFSLFFMINSIGLVAMAQLGARLVKRVPVPRVVLGSQVVMAAGAIGFLAAALTGHPPLVALLVPLFFFLSFFGSMRPNATAIALTNQGAIAGTASAWVGALPFLAGAVLSPLAGLGGEGAATVAGIMLAALCVLGLPCVLLIARNRRCLWQICRRQIWALSLVIVAQAGGMAQESKIPVFTEQYRQVLLSRRVLVLDGVLDDDNGTVLATQLLTLADEDPNNGIALWINSPGGSVPSMLAIRDVMRLIPCDVATLVFGIACSAGQFLLSAGTKGKRYALPHSKILMHQGSSGIGGSAVEVELQAADLRQTRDTVLGLIADDTGQPLERIFEDSRHDHWYTAPEAKDYGFIDGIAETFGQLLPNRRREFGLRPAAAPSAYGTATKTAGGAA